MGMDNMKASSIEGKEDIGGGTVDDTYMQHPQPVNASRSARRIIHLCNLEIFDAASERTDDPSVQDRSLRRFSTLFEEPDRIREGRHAVVHCVTNAWGEKFAVKASKNRPQDVECECHRAVSGRLGFPQLFARGKLNGADALVMEWIEGETLERVRGKLVLDDRGRISPLTAARICRDMCNALVTFQADDANVVHRDISTTNVIVRTSSLSLPQQVTEGVFDVCLIDFGSAMKGDRGSSDVSSRAKDSTAKKDSSAPNAVVRIESDACFDDVDLDRLVATPAFAAPELLVRREGRVDHTMPTSKADVYAVGSVLFLLVTGQLPFDIDDADERAVVEKSFEKKVHGCMKPYVTAHGLDSDLAIILSREPEVAVALGYAISDFRAPLTTQDVRNALVVVDEQLGQIIASCLAIDPDLRPSFTQLESMLSAFCDNYKINIGRALRDEPLEPIYPKRGIWALSYRTQTLVKRIGQGVCTAIGAAVLASSALLIDQVPATFGSESNPIWTGDVSGLLIGVACVVPAVIGYAARGRNVASSKGLMRGTLGLIIGWMVLFVLSMFLHMDNLNAFNLLFSAFIALIATAWCPMVLDFAFPGFRGRRRNKLPPGNLSEILGIPGNITVESIERLSQPATERSSDALNAGMPTDLVDNFPDRPAIGEGGNDGA